jgi:hypothetical protein
MSKAKEFALEYPKSSVYAVSVLLLAICTMHPIGFLAVLGFGGVAWALVAAIGNDF